MGLDPEKLVGVSLSRESPECLPTRRRPQYKQVHYRVTQGRRGMCMVVYQGLLDSPVPTPIPAPPPVGEKDLVERPKAVSESLRE